ncbi:MAG: spermidine synthase [Thiovulaceae bacterium]|nr:spermidine synthase [Sulfurimonadaceae bacterium]MDD3818148.1 spermidine synthase [Sulfurimonadaceae bacterium]
MKPFIYPEMMVHVPLCTHKDPKNILLISDNADAMAAEVQKHQDMSVSVIGCSLDALRNVADKSADVVINEMGCDAAVAAHINRVLKEEGLVVTTHPSLDKVEENKNLMQVMGNYFKIIMPYNLGNGATALLTSKAYHPTADLILHRADMLDNLSYYNCDIHPAAFAMGNYIRKEYLGITKN